MDLEKQDHVKNILGVMQVVGNFLNDAELNALVDAIFEDLGVARPTPAPSVVGVTDAA